MHCRAGSAFECAVKRLSYDFRTMRTFGRFVRTRDSIHGSSEVCVCHSLALFLAEYMPKE
jgi:hypothetical protein